MIIQMWEGMQFQVTENMVPLFPTNTYANFPAKFCGAGHGLGEWVVPDFIFGATKFLPWKLNISIKISPACRIHDLDWQFAEPTWEAFFTANSRLYANIKAIVVKQSEGYPEFLIKQALKYPAVYANAVSSIIGQRIFWNLKKDEGYELPASVLWMVR